MIPFVLIFMKRFFNVGKISCLFYNIIDLNKQFGKLNEHQFKMLIFLMEALFSVYGIKFLCFIKC